MREKKSDREKQAGYIRPRVMPGTLIYDAKADTYKARYSHVWKPAGLHFVRAFEVVYSSYWLESDLFDHDTVSLYNVLNYFAESDLLFTQRGLAHALKRSPTTIRGQLDALENCELIHTLSLSDMHGHPNYYVMCTPLFRDRDALTEKVKKRIREAGDELPKTFFVEHVERYRAAVDENLAKQRREDPDKFPDLEERTHRWNEVIKAFGQDVAEAVEFDRIVCDVAMRFTGRQVKLETFDKIVRYYCGRSAYPNLQEYYHAKSNSPLSRRLKSLAHELRAFYERYWRNGQQVVRGGPAKPKFSLDEQIEIIRGMLEMGSSKEQVYEQFAESFEPHEWEQIVRVLNLD